jgi:(2Fe-2S) ferredoxin
VAVFKPKIVGACRQGPHVCYIWDGRAITGWYEKSAVRGV